jgi:hypothetical protein
MSLAARIVLAVFLASFAGGVVAMLSGVSWWRWVFTPALIFSGWAAFGHWVTLDDDLPGGGSNPNESKVLWRRSLVELSLKALVFVGLAWFVLV